MKRTYTFTKWNLWMSLNERTDINLNKFELSFLFNMLNTTGGNLIEIRNDVDTCKISILGNFEVLFSDDTKGNYTFGTSLISKEENILTSNQVEDFKKLLKLTHMDEHVTVTLN